MALFGDFRFWEKLGKKSFEVDASCFEESSAPRRKTLSLPRERTAQALALAGTASAVGRLVVNVLTIVSTMKYEIQRWNFLE